MMRKNWILIVREAYMIIINWKFRGYLFVKTCYFYEFFYVLGLFFLLYTALRFAFFFAFCHCWVSQVFTLKQGSNHLDQKVVINSSMRYTKKLSSFFYLKYILAILVPPISWFFFFEKKNTTKKKTMLFWKGRGEDKSANYIYQAILANDFL